MDRKSFYDVLRGSALFPHGLSTDQVKGMEALLDAAQGLAADETAYVMATAYHETAETMRPIAEYGKGKGRKYGVPGRNGGQVPYGRGFVQTTWDQNYERTDRELGLGGRLIANYSLLLTDTAMAAQAAVRGMVEGWYTGKKLSDYFAGGKCDFVNARRIINGTDKAEKIASHARVFLKAIQQ
jgi:predicted chitinase